MQCKVLDSSEFSTLMAENYSHLQKLCLDTIQSGAIGAFIEFFRLTHMEQPLGNNQPQSYEDLIGTAGFDAPQLAPQFSFDSPLGMPLTQLSNLQRLLQQADSACLEGDLLTQFCALSTLSDMFLQNHKLRMKVKMLPLVIPYPQYTQLQKTKLNQLLQLIDSPDFRKQVVEQDPLISAIAKLKKETIETQTFPPIVISYALKARNCLFEYIQKELKNSDVSTIQHLLKDAEIKFDDYKDKPKVQPDQQLHFSLLLASCYLRLAISLQEFSLYRAAHQVYQQFLDCVKDMETLMDAQFASRFACTDINGYKVLLQDEHINMGAQKHDDNLAYANMDLVNVPKLYQTILDKRCIPCKWNIRREDLRNYQFVDKKPDLYVETADQINERTGSIEDLCEFVYAGRQMAIMNMIQLACQIFTQQAGSIEGIEVDTAEFDEALVGTNKQQVDKMTVSQLSQPQLPKEIHCTYSEFTISIALLKQALRLSVDGKVYSTTLPAFKRFAELVSQTGIYQCAEALTEAVSLQNQLFQINALAWQARWARQQNKLEQRMDLLKKRLEVSQSAALQDKTAVKYAVAAASELVFSSPGHDVHRMEEAWNDLQASQGSQKVIDQTVIEARVRFGAVKGAQAVENQMGRSEKMEVEEGHDEDLDDVVFGVKEAK